jgi:hypothetical protein
MAAAWSAMVASRAAMAARAASRATTAAPLASTAASRSTSAAAATASAACRASTAADTCDCAAARRSPCTRQRDTLRSHRHADATRPSTDAHQLWVQHQLQSSTSVRQRHSRRRVHRHHVSHKTHEVIHWVARRRRRPRLLHTQNTCVSDVVVAVIQHQRVRVVDGVATERHLPQQHTRLEHRLAAHVHRHEL